MRPKAAVPLVLVLLAAALPLRAAVVAAASSEPVRAYGEAWQRFFGTPAPLPRGFDLPSDMESEEALARMWELCTPALLPSERPAALAALRLRVLGDETASIVALHGLLARGRLTYGDFKGPLFYRFLDETVGDARFLPEVLPPAESSVKLRVALLRRGATQEEFSARFLAWALGRAAAVNLLAGTDLQPPSVWALDGGLRPGQFAVATLPGALPGAWLALESAGDLDPKVRLLTVRIDPDGGGVRQTLAPLPEGRSFLSGPGGRVFVALFNPATGPAALGGLALTFWNSWDLPLAVREANLEEGVLDLTVDISEGLVGLSLWGPGEGGTRGALSPEFPSGGPGRHHYRVLLAGEPPRPGDTLRLSGRAVTGGEVHAEFQPEVTGRRPQVSP